MAKASDNVFPQSSPRRHGRLSSDNHPGPLATLAQHCVELSSAQGHCAAIRQRHGTTGQFDRDYKGAFGG
jgi:hypothetical protein